MATIATSVVIYRPVDVVYAYFIRPEQLWGTRPGSPIQAPPGLVGLGTHLRGRADTPDGPVETDLEVVELVPDARLAVRDRGMGQRRAEWAYTFTSLPEGTRVDFAQELALPSAAKTTPDLGDPTMNTIAQTFAGFIFDQVHT
ncbi:MAG: hypothetical protein M3010_13050, partial [Candidatus Dormibacteraeota bacterium]|nr:hypothetical protein [Candidatus Dormibacteraeota bacterium]